MNLEKTVKKYRELFVSAPKVETAHGNDGHFYVSPTTGEEYHSVTYYTSFIKDPALSNWRMNRALEYIRQNVGELDDEIPDFGIGTMIDQAKSAPEGEFLLAGDIGAETHAWREAWFKAWIMSGKVSMTDEEIDLFPIISKNPEVISGCRAIKKFLKETGAIPVACELPLVDDDLKVGGTIDDLMVFPNLVKLKIFEEKDVEGENWKNVKGVEYHQNSWMKGGYKEVYRPYLGFVDLKTANQGKKPTYAYQVRGFYQRMIWKTFHVRPKKTYILHTSKADGTYKLIDLTEMKFLQQDAKQLVRLSRSWDKVTEAFKPKVITI